MSVLRIPQAVYNDLRAHGKQEYPRECCGVLLGLPTPDGWRIQSLVRASNARADSAHNRYEIAPAELIVIANHARSLKLEIAGFYHSHPDHPAEWSTTDLAEAHWIGCCYLITEVVHGRAVATNSFLLAGASEGQKLFEPQTIQILGNPDSSPDH